MKSRRILASNREIGAILCAPHVNLDTLKKLQKPVYVLQRPRVMKLEREAPNLLNQLFPKFKSRDVLKELRTKRKCLTNFNSFLPKIQSKILKLPTRRTLKPKKNSNKNVNLNKKAWDLQLRLSLVTRPKLSLMIQNRTWTRRLAPECTSLNSTCPRLGCPTVSWVCSSSWVSLHFLFFAACLESGTIGGHVNVQNAGFRLWLTAPVETILFRCPSAMGTRRN